MSVAIVVQSDAGTVDGANAYIDVAYMRSYCALRGLDLGVLTDDQLAVAIVQATDYEDNRWRFKGRQLLSTQTTEWPREHVRNSRGDVVTGLPEALKKATAEYAFRAKDARLQADTLPTGGQLVAGHTVKVDVIEESFTYSTTPGYTVFQEYPSADGILKAAGLVLLGGMRTVR